MAIMCLPKNEISPNVNGILTFDSYNSGVVKNI